MSLRTSVESLVLRPYYALEKYVASKQIPPLSRAPAPLRRLADAPGYGAGGETAVDHGAWDELLQKHVRTYSGRVDYEGLRDDRAKLDSYFDALAAVDVKALLGREQLALYLNAYNAFCIRHVLDNPGVRSILDLSVSGEPIWDKVAGVVGGEELSLNAIEHAKLRLVWDAPELHACIVCASVSCPSLSDRAFLADGLEERMRERAAAWLTDTSKGCRVEKGGALRLSRICLWFADDFASRGGPAAFAGEHAEAARALGRGPALRYFEYDWGLNAA